MEFEEPLDKQKGHRVSPVPPRCFYGAEFRNTSCSFFAISNVARFSVSIRSSKLLNLNTRLTLDVSRAMSAKVGPCFS
jgi:hypothetical protein